MNYFLKLNKYQKAIEFSNNMSGYTSVDQNFLEMPFKNYSFLRH